MHDSKLGDSILDSLVHSSITFYEDRIEVLFQDFVVCAVLGEKHYGANVPALSSGITERAVTLGLYASALDMDDVRKQIAESSESK